MVKNKPILIIVVILLIIIGVYWYTSSNKMKDTDMDKKNTDLEVVVEDTKDAENMEETEKMAVSYTDVSPAEAKELIESNDDLIIIDVSPKYDEGHIPGSVNYYVGDGSLDEAIPNLDTEKTYLVYCHTDEASILGAQKLTDAGFTKVYRLEGNYSAWVDAGYEVETATNYVE